MNDVYRCDFQINSSVQRPDFVGRILNNVVWSGSGGAGEVKEENKKNYMTITTTFTIVNQLNHLLPLLLLHGIYSSTKPFI